MIRVRHHGDFSRTEKFFRKLKYGTDKRMFEKYGQQGVAALSKATPVDSGLTASSWYYVIVQTDSSTRIEFRNSNIQNGWAPIAILLQYGHATRSGSWVEGRDYINPAIQPIFDKIADDAWKEVLEI